MKTLNGEAQMKQALRIALHVVGGLAVAVTLAAVLAAPGFLSDQSSTIRLSTVAEIIGR